jgi:choline-glycine betaine transporter
LLTSRWYLPCSNPVGHCLAIFSTIACIHHHSKMLRQLHQRIAVVEEEKEQKPVWLTTWYWSWWNAFTSPNWNGNTL